jgi:hypothetical protein
MHTAKHKKKEIETKHARKWKPETKQARKIFQYSFILLAPHKLLANKTNN